MAKPKFFGLLYIGEGMQRHVNLQNSDNPIDVYLRCAALCARSFHYHGYEFQLITNKPDALNTRMSRLGLIGLELVFFDFRLDVPLGISFFEAHFKLELFEAFGLGLFGDHVALVDIDTVLLRRFSEGLLDTKGLVGYDLTAGEVADYGASKIAGAVSAVAGEELEPAWWGGEFLLGHSNDFLLLSNYIKKIWPNYKLCWRKLHHQGDEVVTSAAVSLMQRDGNLVINAAATGDVHRWWSARTLNPSVSLKEAYTRSLLHLPADKSFLADQCDAGHFDPDKFMENYKSIAWRKAVARQLVDLIRCIFPKGPRKFAPRIS